MAISKRRQMYLLLSKNYKLQRRKPFFAIFTYLVPIGCFAIVLLLRSNAIEFTQNKISFSRANIRTGLLPIVLYVPNTTAVNKIMEKMRNIYPIHTEGFKTEHEMIDNVTERARKISNNRHDFHRGDQEIIGLVFVETDYRSFTYKLRPLHDSDSEWHTKNNFPPLIARLGKHSRGSMQSLYESGFLSIQYILTATLIAMKKPQNETNKRWPQVGNDRQPGTGSHVENKRGPHIDPQSQVDHAQGPVNGPRRRTNDYDGRPVNDPRRRTNDYDGRPVNDPQIDYENNRRRIPNTGDGRQQWFRNTHPQGRANDIPTIFTHRRPYPRARDDDFIELLDKIPVLFIMSCLMISIVIVKDIIYEREKRLKEAMLLMGLQSSMYWAAWFVQYIVYFITLMGIATVVMCVSADSKKVLGNSDPSVVLLFFMSYGVSLLCFCFMFSSFFRRENRATLAVFGVLITLTIPWYAYFHSRYETLSGLAKIVCCLDFNIACCTGFYTIKIFMGMEDGATWNNFAKPSCGVSLFHVVMMLNIDSLLHLTILWYVGNVWPGEFGIPQPWNFPFLKRYWLRGMITQPELDDENLYYNQACFEKASTTLTPGVVISHLRKKYGRIVAVADMSLTMYYDQITVLLGHNGAGKTTTMSMLTGFIPPTSGTAVVNGYDIKKDIASVRDSVGLCPQHDVLFDNLTAREHVIFYTQLKGKPKKDAVIDTNEMLELVGLTEKANARAKTLSGGQKRKLSLAITLSGGSKVIILDEPSSAMDPSARRELWDILRKIKPGRAIILATHFMDEADILGDRIAILGNGVVKCCGSSLFLKNLYGTGYHLTIVKGRGFKREETNSLICRDIPNAEIFNEAGADIIFKLSRTHREKFATVFKNLEDAKHALNIDNFGINETTMDDVFFKVGEDEQVEIVKNTSLVSVRVSKPPSQISVKTVSNAPDNISTLAKNNNVSAATTDKDSEKKSTTIPQTDVCYKEDKSLNLIKFNENLQKNTGKPLAVQRFYALLAKKAIITKRNISTTIIIQFIVPIAVTSLVLSIIKNFIDTSTAAKFGNKIAAVEIPLHLNFDDYPESIVPLAVYDTSSPYAVKFSKNYKSLFVKSKAVIETTTNVSNFYLTRMKKQSVPLYKNNYMIGAEIFGEERIVAYYSVEGYHLIAISFTYVLNAWFKTELGSEYSIHAANHPFKAVKQEKNENRGPSQVEGLGLQPELSIPIGFSMILAMAMSLSIFAIYIIKERISRSKHVQISIGVSPSLYLLSHLVWDILVCVVLSSVITILFTVIDIEAYTGEHRTGLVFLVLVAYSCATLTFVYMLSLLFSTGGGAVGFLIVYSFVSGVLLTTARYDIDKKKISDMFKKHTEIERTSSDYIFLALSPSYCIAGSFMNIFFVHIFNTYQETKGNSVIKDYVVDNFFGIGVYIIAMFGHSLLFGLVTLLIENRFMQKFCANFCGEVTIPSVLRSNEEFEDRDVVNERKRIQNDKYTLVKENPIVIDKISKVFGNLLAVEQISIAVPTNQCFGLLGVNGAGKTTAFKMLMGEISMTEGDAYINGISVRENIRDVLKDIGYCPQYNPLLEQMTCRETLFMCARLRGIISSIIPRVVDDLMTSVMLMQYADNTCSTLSGGNMRKLSTAMALIGDPSVVFLDEPTTGMDPVARRQIWNILSQIRSTGRTLVFTSHSMEECDALCDRIGIMVNGLFRCLGSSQHLKSKFGEGYILTLKIASPSESEQPNLEPIIAKIERDFPNHKQLSANMNHVHYQLTDATLSLSHIFGIMEEAREPYNIEDYSVTQTTLDQIFVNFAKTQREQKTTNAGSCKTFCLACVK